MGKCFKMREMPHFLQEKDFLKDGKYIILDW